MNWLNLQTSIARSAEYIGAEPTQRSTWFSLISWCADQENGGIIRDCKSWKDRRWQQTAGVTADEVSDVCDLYFFDGDDLHIYFYPTTKEDAVKAGRSGGKSGGRPPKKTPPKTPSKTPPETSPKTQREEKRREDKVREREKTGGKTPPPALSLVEFSSSDSPDPDLAEKVNSCRPQWQEAPGFSKFERIAFLENLEQLRSIRPDGWEAIRSYLAARLPQGTGGFQPYSREKFLSAAGDVLTRALDWKRKQPSPKHKPKPIPESNEPPLSAAETAEILGIKTGT